MGGGEEEENNELKDVEKSSELANKSKSNKDPLLDLVDKVPTVGSITSSSNVSAASISHIHNNPGLFSKTNVNNVASNINMNQNSSSSSSISRSTGTQSHMPTSVPVKPKAISPGPIGISSPSYPNSNYVSKSSNFNLINSSYGNIIEGEDHEQLNLNLNSSNLNLGDHGGDIGRGSQKGGSSSSSTSVS